eukprot:jgi/Chrzof1/6688/Cz19g05230.t1
MYATLKTSGPRANCFAVRPASDGVNRAMRIVPRAERDNPYHDRDHQKTKNPGGTKDANQIRQDKQDQYEYQQERLEWRRKNQFEGKEDREEPPHNNMAGDMSAEKRGPEVKDNTGHSSDTLADKENPIGKVIRKLTGSDE